MKRISFNPCFVNETGNDLISGKIHTIRQNYEYWKRFEGKEVALFTWEGKPYRSKQKVFCVKRIVSVQLIEYKYGTFWEGEFHLLPAYVGKNDGVKDFFDFKEWFNKGHYKPGKMAILHFTDFRY